MKSIYRVHLPYEFYLPVQTLKIACQTVDQFIHRLVKEFNDRNLRSWDDLDERVKTFFTPEQMRQTGQIVPHWQKMASYMEGLTLTHVMCVFTGMCRMPEPPENGLAASHPNDFTLVLRALRWTTNGPGLDEAVRACGRSRGPGAGASVGDEPRYARRFVRLGVPIEARARLIQRGAESLLLELEAPVAKLPIVEGLYDRWVREVAAGR